VVPPAAGKASVSLITRELSFARPPFDHLQPTERPDDWDSLSTSFTRRIPRQAHAQELQQFLSCQISKTFLLDLRGGQADGKRQLRFETPALNVQCIQGSRNESITRADSAGQDTQAVC